jgi:hypothetical protein
VSSPIGALLASDTCTVLSSATGAEASEHLLAAAQTFGLTVYTPNGEEIPSALAEHATTVGPWMLDRMVSRHAVYINTDSAGLPARALQALATGAVVVSVANPSLEEAFPGLISVARSTEDAKEAIERLLSDDGYRTQTRAAALRAVLSAHTIRHRLGSIARAVGYELDEESDARVTALVLVDEVAEGDALVRSLTAQRQPLVEILIGVAGETPPTSAEEEERRVRLIQQGRGMSPTERMQALAALATSPWVAPFPQGSTPNVNDLFDLVLAQRFARADVLGTGEAFVFADRLAPGCSIARRDVVASRGWPPEPAWARDGVRIFTVPR